MRDDEVLARYEEMLRAARDERPAVLRRRGLGAAVARDRLAPGDVVDLDQLPDDFPRETRVAPLTRQQLKAADLHPAFRAEVDHLRELFAWSPDKHAAATRVLSRGFPRYEASYRSIKAFHLVLDVRLVEFGLRDGRNEARKAARFVRTWWLWPPPPPAFGWRPASTAARWSTRMGIRCRSILPASLRPGWQHPSRSPSGSPWSVW
ncbi:MAG TPA: hypothetical protein VFC93_00485 [Chloroflexota bacterium]|nr:hypothetical protein [Chloroflexota bacterium]